MDDYVEAPCVTLDNDDPTLHDEEVRSFIDAENTKAATLFAQMAETSDEREQLQRYADALVIVYRAGYLATSALLGARTEQVRRLLAVNDDARRSLAKTRDDLVASRSQLQSQRAARVEPKDSGAPIVINVSAGKPGSRRVERDQAGNVVRVVDEPDDEPTGRLASR